MSTQAGQPHSGTDVGTFRRERLFALFFFATYFFLLYQLLRILSPFLGPLLAAAMLAVVVYPLCELVTRKLRHPTAAALLVTAGLLVTVIVPLALLIWMVTREASNTIPSLVAWLDAQQSHGWVAMTDKLPEGPRKIWSVAVNALDIEAADVKAAAADALRRLGNRATLLGATFIGGLFGFLFNLVIMILALFLFLRDGQRMVQRLLQFVPMENIDKQLILERVARTLVAMLRSTVITASAQGITTGVGLAIFGVPFPILLGFVATVMAVVPVVGAALVWAPAALYLLFTDRTGAALGLAAWGLFGVSLIDNFLRPLVIGGHTRLPVPLLFLGVIGGIEVYGLEGGLLSPIIIACVFAFARIYQESYLFPSSSVHK